jgi:hypothetical protein
MSHLTNIQAPFATPYFRVLAKGRFFGRRGRVLAPLSDEGSREMIRSVVGKVMWVGRATVFLVGLAVTLALVFGVATAALGANGDFFKLGQRNVAQTVSTLVKKGTGSALALQVGADQPPLTVNAAAGTARGLSADELDGKDSTELEPRGYARVSHSGPTLASSKGVIGVQRVPPQGEPPQPTGIYCFDLAFTPNAAVASGHINNNATVGTIVGSSNVPSGCQAPYRDAAARTFAANTSEPRDDLSFGIVFM